MITAINIQDPGAELCKQVYSVKQGFQHFRPSIKEKLTNGGSSSSGERAVCLVYPLLPSPFHPKLVVKSGVSHSRCSISGTGREALRTQGTKTGKGRRSRGHSKIWENGAQGIHTSSVHVTWIPTSLSTVGTCIGIVVFAHTFSSVCDGCGFSKP